MAYTRLHWVESETPLSADNMNNIEDGIEELQSQKVDKASGKALSDNNYTTAEKTKLAGIEAGAEVNVQPDWNQSNSSADDYIQNKPVNATTSVAGFMSATDKSKLDGVQAGAQVNRTYTAATGKPTANASPAFGGTVTVSQVSQSTTGQVSVADRVITIPSSDATTSTHGLMTAADKTKLNGIAAYAEVNQNAFSNVKVGSTTVAADGKTDTLELVAGSNVTLTPDATNDKVTIAATDTKYNAATTSAAGLMSAADKTKLNGISSEAVHLDWETLHPAEQVTLNEGAIAEIITSDCSSSNIIGLAEIEFLNSSGNQIPLAICGYRRSGSHLLIKVFNPRKSDVTVAKSSRIKVYYWE